MKKLLLVIALAITTQFGFAQEITFKQDVIKFFEATGSSLNMISDQILPMIDEADHENFKKDFSVLVDDFYTKVTEVFQEELTQEDVKSLVAIIEKAKTDQSDNMAELIQASEAGKKFAEKEKIIDEKMQNKLMTWSLDLQLMMSRYGIE